MTVGATAAGDSADAVAARIARLTTSRWRNTPTTSGRGAADRVRRSHAQARRTVGLALVFVCAAAVAAGVGEGSWLAFHLFLAGGVVLAISGVSLTLTVTWSAAPAPPNGAVLLQRICIAAGAAGVAAARELELGSVVVAVAGCAHLAGLALLAVLLVTTVRHGAERRFDVAVAAYCAALAAGAAGVGFGVAMAVDTPSPQLRDAHLTLNLFGLVGLVVGGTLPFFAATVGRSRMAPTATRPRLAVAVGWQASALAIMAIGLGADADMVATAGLAAYAIGIVGILWLVPRPTRRQLRWAGPRLLALWAGTLWWVATVIAAAVEAARDGVPFDDQWLRVLVVAGYAQILWGSLAYLVPMLRGGGHERLAAGFATTRSWTGLIAANVAGLAFALSASPVAAVAITVWVIDAGTRLALVGLGGPAGRIRREQGD